LGSASCIDRRGLVLSEYRQRQKQNQQGGSHGTSPIGQLNRSTALSYTLYELL
jgi:hypothetical protein